ncbi:hypothetical protein QZP90_20100, partial [Serratia marcescens]|nr:hypothetical protein [Serratia marcescens]
MKNIVENQDIKTDKPLPMSYEALKAERDALAVENAALNKSLDDVCESYENGQSDLLSEAIDKAINLPSPATDAALAAIQAQGVEKAAAALDALSAQSASATTKANFRAAAVYLRAEVLPVIG